MNKRITIDMPEDMLRLIEAQAAKLGRSPDAYVKDIIEERLEDDYFLARAEDAMEQIARGETRTYSWEELPLDDQA